MFLHPRSVQPSSVSTTPSDGDGETQSLSSDHFSGDDLSALNLDQQEGHFGTSTEEELQQAISRCRDAILESAENTDERRRRVRQLIELRLRLLELQERPDPLPEGSRLVRGHVLQPQATSRRREYCDQCASLILALLHRWYACQGCSLHVHAACVEDVRRNCAVERVREQPQYQLSICPERGLSYQRFQCEECGRRVMPEPDYSSGPPSGDPSLFSPRRCDYTGRFYCCLCHWEDRAVSPARVIHNWDFDKYPVSCASRQYLELMCRRPVLDVEKCNPKLFSFVEELRHVKKLREEMMLMKQYFLSCRAALQSRILLAFGDRQYFAESSHLYSMRDLTEVRSGELLPFLMNVHAKFARHIREECEACRGKGHICEVCSGSEVLFAFDALVVACPRCRRVMHQHCYVKRDGQCPRCARLTARQSTDQAGAPAADEGQDAN